MTDGLYTIQEIADKAGVCYRNLWMYLKYRNLLSQFVRKRGKKRLFSEEFCDRICRNVRPPSDWTGLKDIARQLKKKPITVRRVIERIVKDCNIRIIMHDIYLSPEAVSVVTEFYADLARRKELFMLSKRGQDYLRQKERDADRWINEPVDESKLVWYDDFLLTPEQHARRLEIRIKRFNDVPKFVIDEFKKSVPPPQKRTAIDVPELVADYQDGMNISDLARKYKFSRPVIIKRLKRAGVYVNCYIHEPIEFVCPVCGAHVVTTPETGDKRTRFCSYKCQSEFHKHKKRYTIKLS